MNVRTTIICVPIRDSERTLAFYRNVLGLPDIQIDSGIIALEIPNLSLFLMETGAFETYSRKSGRQAQFADDKAAGVIISCAMTSKEAVDSILENAPKHGGAVKSKAAMDAASGGYIGYFSDPDGYLWELVFPQQQ